MTRLILLGGFLGSGKTTTLLRLAFREPLAQSDQDPATLTLFAQQLADIIMRRGNAPA